jgi:hypothetical protein
MMGNLQKFYKQALKIQKIIMAELKDNRPLVILRA